MVLLMLVIAAIFLIGMFNLCRIIIGKKAIDVDSLTIIKIVGVIVVIIVLVSVFRV